MFVHHTVTFVKIYNYLDERVIYIAFILLLNFKVNSFHEHIVQ